MHVPSGTLTRAQAQAWLLQACTHTTVDMFTSCLRPGGRLRVIGRTLSIACLGVFKRFSVWVLLIDWILNEKLEQNNRHTRMQQQQWHQRANVGMYVMRTPLRV